MAAHESREKFEFLARPTRLASVTAAMLFLLAARAQASVVHVSGSGNALSNAVDAAIDGDTLVVTEGTYSGFTLDGLFGKGLTIVADDHAAVTVTSLSIVRYTPPGHDTVLSGLHFTGGLQVIDCDCAVRLQSVVSEGSVPEVSLFPGLYLSDDSDVALVRCTLRGEASSTFPNPTSSTEGLVVSSSQVALYDCLVQGGAGHPSRGKSFPASIGAAGLSAADSIVVASKCGFIGGNGGPASSNIYCMGAAGGDGIRFAGSGSGSAVCYLRECHEQGGTGGFSICGPNAADGSPLDFLGSAVLISFPAEQRELAAPRLAREHEPIRLVLSGVPGDRVILFYAQSTRFEISTPFQGVFLYGTPWRSARIGTIPAGGTLNATLLVPDLAPGVAAGVLYLQGLFVDGAGATTLGSPSFLVVLDSLP